MKIGIISDAHLFHKWAISPKMYYNIVKNQMIDCDVIVDCGDLVDKSVLTAKQSDELFKIFSDINKKMYIVAGNHDSGENTTVASILKLNKNITVIEDKPQVIEDFLFVPYTNSLNALYKELDRILKEPVKYAFSHLNVTDNLYASLSFKDLKKMYKYSDCWFNGHIHQPEKESSVFGNFYNVGSCSSLTFGDEHFPCYIIFDTETKEYNQHHINESIVHRKFDMSKLKDMQGLKEALNRVLDQYSCSLRCSILIENDDKSAETRQKIRDMIQDYNDRILSVSFSYIAVNKSKVQESNIKREKRSKINMMQQLIEKYEQDTGAKLLDSVKKDILDI